MRRGANLGMAEFRRMEERRGRKEDRALKVVSSRTATLDDIAALLQVERQSL
jgi:hypothetical protein